MLRFIRWKCWACGKRYFILSRNTIALHLIGHALQAHNAELERLLTLIESNDV